jgi:Alpha-L-arabinofuranosidase B (ABFB) domain
MELPMNLRPLGLAASAVACLLGFGTATGTPSPDVVSLRALRPVNYFVMHQDFVGRADELRSTQDARDTQVRIVQGLADPRCVSMVSVNPPDHYFKAAFFRIVLAKRLDEQRFRSDATFCIESGLEKTQQWGLDAVSFRSRSFPDRYIRHRDGELRLDELQDTPDYRASATFFIVPRAHYGEFLQEGTWNFR